MTQRKRGCPKGTITKPNGKYGREWQKIAIRYRREHKFCEICKGKGKWVRSVETHHIIPVSEGGTNNDENLLAVCRECHDKIHHRIRLKEDKDNGEV